MSKFTGKAARIGQPRTEVWPRLADLGRYTQYLEQLPEEVRNQVGDLRFTDDSIVINAPGVGEITLQRTEKAEPERMTFEALGSPVPMYVHLQLSEADGGAATEILPVIEVDIPVFARPFVAPKLQAAADKMGELLQQLLKA